MKTRILSNQEQLMFRGANLAVSVDYSDVAGFTSGAAQALFSVLAGTQVQCLGYKMPTAFDVSGTGALAVTIGDGGSATALMASSVLAVDGTEVFYHAGGSAKVYLVDDTVDAFFTDATSMAYTSGKVVFYFNVTNMAEWPEPV